MLAWMCDGGFSQKDARQSVKHKGSFRCCCCWCSGGASLRSAALLPGCLLEERGEREQCAD